MLKLKNLTMKNFLSVGNVTQTVKFDQNDFVLVLGENLDLGGNDSRNGVGKSTIINALSYAIYGTAMNKIKKPNLINKTNGKGMLVTLDFNVDGVDYRIERGKKQEILRFVIDGHPLKDPDSDEAQGENRFTQMEIERKVGFSANMFKNIVALTTNGEPFLGCPAAAQREVIEHLLGITKMSEKAEKLRDAVKVTKDNVKKEEFKISALQEANKRIEANIKSLKTKSTAWNNKHKGQLAATEEAITAASHVDITVELERHKSNQVASEREKEKRSLDKDMKSLNREITALTKLLTTTEKSASMLSESLCPTCGQEMDNEKHQALHDEHQQQITDTQKKIDEKGREKEELSERILLASEGAEFADTFYESIDDAYEHKSTLEGLVKELERLQGETNPFIDEIDSLTDNALQEVDFDTMNDFVSVKEHQEFLLKLLTNKDSFIRKKIVNQNLCYLNTRLEYYLEKMGLPHAVEFQSDLTVDITEHGRDLDFDNLSRGEKTRLGLSLSWAFRDVYEKLNTGVNLMFIDELLDNGLDTSGVEAAVGVLKSMNRESKRNIFLISHRDELQGRIDDVLYVRKEGGFTSFSEQDD